ncbi:acyl carrier protein [Pseudomonadales bacterium]|nr:acyl carrier protein [Pseudomonadales bacterium]
MTDIKNVLFEVMADVLQVDVSEISEVSAPGIVEEWDSLKHMLLLIALEEEFEVRFTDDEMVECTSGATILAVLTNKVG